MGPAQNLIQFMTMNTVCVVLSITPARHRPMTQSHNHKALSSYRASQPASYYISINSVMVIYHNLRARSGPCRGWCLYCESKSSQFNQ